MLHSLKNPTQKIAKDKNYRKARDYWHLNSKYRGAAHGVSNLRFNVPNEILAVFCNGSNYNYHFIIKELGNEFESQFECLGENSEKYKTFSFPIRKETRNAHEDGNDDIASISYKIKFINSAILSNILIWQKEFVKINGKIEAASLNTKVSLIVW